MAEVSLVGFARLAAEVAAAVLPRYRSKFSEHVFTQPQLLAVLCLMRYEDWMFREAEVRLREHRELRRALRLRWAPDYTTLDRFLRRLDEPTLARALAEVIRRLPPARRPGTTLAVDATGLAPGAVSTFVLRAPGARPGSGWRADDLAPVAEVAHRGRPRASSDRGSARAPGAL